jgi:hypothetical protein
MATMTDNAARTAHLLALMKKGDDAFNARDFAAVDAVHHPQMVAHITGNAQPIYGSVKHAEAMQQMLRIFPDMHVHTPYPVQLGGGDWITVVSRATGTFTGEMILPQRQGDRSDWKKVRRGSRSDHEVGRRPAHHHLGLLGRRCAGEAAGPRLMTSRVGATSWQVWSPRTRRM